VILRIVLFRLRPDLSDYDSRLLLATIAGTVRSIPGIVSFNVGRRVDEGGAYTIGEPDAGTPQTEYEYAAVFQFENLKALQDYLRHPAQKELRSRFAAVVSAATTADYTM